MPSVMAASELPIFKNHLPASGPHAAPNMSFELWRFGLTPQWPGRPPCFVVSLVVALVAGYKLQRVGLSCEDRPVAHYQNV